MSLALFTTEGLEDRAEGLVLPLAGCSTQETSPSTSIQQSSADPVGRGVSEPDLRS